MIDPHAKLLTYLKAQSELSDSVGGRIYSVDLIHKSEIPALVFKRDGGVDNEPYLEISFECIVYANDDITADQIDGYLHDAMFTYPDVYLLDYGINWINNDVMGQVIEFPEYDKYKLRQSFYTVSFDNSI